MTSCATKLSYRPQGSSTAGLMASALKDRNLLHLSLSIYIHNQYIYIYNNIYIYMCMYMCFMCLCFFASKGSWVRALGSGLGLAPRCSQAASGKVKYSISVVVKITVHFGVP